MTMDAGRMVQSLSLTALILRQGEAARNLWA
jgi:hypothetical protein